MRSSGLQGCPGNASSQDKNAENLPKWYASVEVGTLAVVLDTCLVSDTTAAPLVPPFSQ